jgi:type III secretory pathway component EscT
VINLVAYGVINLVAYRVMNLIAYYVLSVAGHPVSRVRGAVSLYTASVQNGLQGTENGAWLTDTIIIFFFFSVVF